MLQSFLWHLENFRNSEKFFLMPFSALLSFIFSFGLILIFIPLLHKYGIVDNPSERRAHLRPTARGGGIALVISYLVSIIIITNYYSLDFEPAALFSSVLILAVISFLDDIKGTGIIIRLFTHLICSYICIKFYLSPHLIFRGEVSPFIDLLLCMFALTAFLNIFNFLDGIDGISAMQSIHLSLTTIFLCIIRDKIIIQLDLIFLSSSILLGCSLAFLIFNWNPAKIFLGDVGSTFLGLFHGLNLLLIAASSERLFLAASIATLYYIADGGITLLIRIIKKEKIWLPHLNHFFQQAARKGMSQKEIVSKIAFCNILLFFFSVSSIYIPHISIIFSIITVSYSLVHFHHGK